MTTPEFVIEYLDPASLQPHPLNFRRHPAVQTSALQASIEQHGWLAAPIWNKQTRRILDGHARVELALENGDERIPCRVIDVPEAQEKRILASFDRIGSLAERDDERLAELLQELQASEAGLPAGWEAQDLETLLEEMGQGGGEPGSGNTPDQEAAKVTLAERFGVPPFSVLDARQGYWQERKRAWLAMGIESELGRGIVNLEQAHPETTSTIDFYAQKRRLEAEAGRPLTKDEAATLMAAAGHLKNSRAQMADYAAPLVGRHGSDNGLLGESEQALSHYRSASPGGSARQAARLGEDGHTVRGDGKGRKMASNPGRNSGQDLMRGEHVVGEKLGLTPGQAEFDTYRVRNGEQETTQTSGTSIFDPVLCELAYRWFCPERGRVLDPFAGGSVRGIVAGCLGRSYVGIDLSEGQIAANRLQAERIGVVPEWIVGDSRDCVPLVGGEFDFVFSCPPYADLEVYSDDPRDLSTLAYPAFLAAYREIIAASVARLKENRFACFVVGDVRDPKGFYRNFVADTVAAFQDAGMRLYNDAVLVTAVGSLPIRVGKQFGSYRKLGKTHQSVVVFYRGDPQRIPEIAADCQFGDVGEEESADDGTPI